MDLRRFLFPIVPTIVILIIISAIAAFPQLQQKWLEPLDAVLGLPTTISSDLKLPPPSVMTTSQSAVQPTDLPVSLLEVTLVPLESTQKIPVKTFCGGPEQLYILGVGADSGIDYYYGLADVIRIARIDFVTPGVTVLAIPRDLWVEMPDLVSSYNITHGKLNQAYLYGGPGMGYYTGPGGGPGLLARTLAYNFDIRVDHYAAVNMETFAKIIDALGGIDVYLPNAVDGSIDGHGFYPAGKNHLTGTQALDLARIRALYNDFIRQDHQSLVIDAILEKFKDPLIFIKIPKLLSAFQDSILTDLSLQQISQLICLYPKLERDNIKFIRLPDEIMTSDRIYSPQQKDYTYILQADFEVIKNFISRFKAGTWPD